MSPYGHLENVLIVLVVAFCAVVTLDCQSEYFFLAFLLYLICLVFCVFVTAIM